MVCDEIFLVLSVVVTAAFANRAFPLSSENYAIKHFQRINPSIDYDFTNFLVDLSGRKVLCSKVGTRGPQSINEKTKDGRTITSLFDYGRGGAADAPAVNKYIMEQLSGWNDDPQFSKIIRNADTFGCSVRPACDDYFVIGCLFAGDGDGGIDYILDPTEPSGKQYALAFTNEQYGLAEGITHLTWDRNHFLENLSGYETDCTLVTLQTWNPLKVFSMAKDEGMQVSSVFGVAENKGETEPAMIEVLSGMGDQLAKVGNHKQIGCSVIPDCIYNSKMYVVVGCIYNE